MIKKKLQEMRIKKKILQEDMARLVFMTQATYSRKERGKTHITMLEWKIISEVLNVRLEDIYEDEKNNPLEAKLNINYLSVPNIMMENLSYYKDENLKLKNKVQLLKKELKNVQK